MCLLPGFFTTFGVALPVFAQELDAELQEALKLNPEESSSIEVPAEPTLIKVVVRGLDQRILTGFKIRNVESSTPGAVSVEIQSAPGYRFQTNELTPKRVTADGTFLRIDVAGRLPGPFWVSLYDDYDKRKLAQIALGVRADSHQFQKTESCESYDLQFEVVAGEGVPDHIKVDCRETEQGTWILLFHGDDYEIVPIETSVKSERDQRAVRYFLPPYLLHSIERTDVGTFKLVARSSGRALTYYRLTVRSGASSEAPGQNQLVEKPARSHFELTGGFAIFNYEDARARFRFQEFSFALRASWKYQILPRWLVLYIGGRAAPLTLSKDPASASAALFLQGNASIVFGIPRQLFGGKPWLHAGIGTFSFKASNNSYGTDSSVGPQFGLSQVWGDYKTERGKQLDIVYGVFGNTSGIRIGGSYQLNSPARDRVPFLLTLEGWSMSTRSISTSNDASVTGFIANVGWRF